MRIDPMTGRFCQQCDWQACSCACAGAIAQPPAHACSIGRGKGTWPPRDQQRVPVQAGGCCHQWLDKPAVQGTPERRDNGSARPAERGQSGTGAGGAEPGRAAPKAEASADAQQAQRRPAGSTSLPAHDSKGDIDWASIKARASAAGFQPKRQSSTALSGVCPAAPRCCSWHGCGTLHTPCSQRGHAALPPGQQHCPRLLWHDADGLRTDHLLAIRSHVCRRQRVAQAEEPAKAEAHAFEDFSLPDAAPEPPALPDEVKQDSVGGQDADAKGLGPKAERGVRPSDDATGPPGAPAPGQAAAPSEADAELVAQLQPPAELGEQVLPGPRLGPGQLNSRPLRSWDASWCTPCTWLAVICTCMPLQGEPAGQAHVGHPHMHTCRAQAFLHWMLLRVQQCDAGAADAWRWRQVWQGTLSWQQKSEPLADACAATATALTGQANSFKALGRKVGSLRPAGPRRSVGWAHCLAPCQPAGRPDMALSVLCCCARGYSAFAL